MEMKPDTSHVLMSETLRGNVPELEDTEHVDVPRGKHVIVIAEKVVGPTTTGLIGILRGVLFDVEPEIEIRIELKEALDVIEANNLLFKRFELHHEERIVNIPGPFKVKAARIDDISAQDQLCTISLHLKKHV